MLTLGISYPKEFSRLWRKLQRKYPTELFNLEGVGEQLDINKFSTKFFTNKTTTADVSVDSNANVSDKSVIAFDTEVSKPYQKLDSYYMLWKTTSKIFGRRTANEIIERALNGDIYINDFHGFASGKPYCFNYSTYDIATKGLPMVDKITSTPPKYLYSFKSQVEQFITIASNSTLGATGLADLLLVMSFYVEDIIERCGDSHFKFASEEDCWLYVAENIVSMIYTVNQPMRGNQSPFTNVSLFDKVFLQKLAKDYLHPRKATPLNIDVVMKLQVIFMDIMNRELARTPVTFPVTSACISIDAEKNIKDENFLELVCDKNMENAFMNIYLGKTSTLSSCCRLRSDMLENEYFNSFGAGSTKIGSSGVATINGPRLAFKYQHLKDTGFIPSNPSGDSLNDFYREAKHLAELCFKVNYVRREIIKKRIETGFHPIYTYGFIELEKQYATLGIVGFNEVIEIMGFDPLSEQGVAFGIDFIKTVTRVNNRLGKKYSVPVNMEQIPAENTAVKLVKKDKLLGYNNGEYELYSNQFIPLIKNADMLDRIKLQGIYDEHFSGGSILHLNVEQQSNNVQADMNLIKSSGKMGVVYLAKNLNHQRCANGHMSVGKRDTCPKCGAVITDNFTRVVGFLTNTKHWERVRREHDYPLRKWY
jgi:ribonucleoside-triphosphate reductase